MTSEQLSAAKVSVRAIQDRIDAAVAQTGPLRADQIGEIRTNLKHLCATLGYDLAPRDSRRDDVNRVAEREPGWNLTHIGPETYVDWANRPVTK